MIDTIDDTMNKLRAINQAYYNEREMAKLDAQGRHRSEWCYSYYDGRQQREIPQNEINDKDHTE